MSAEIGPLVVILEPQDNLYRPCVFLKTNALVAELMKIEKWNKQMSESFKSPIFMGCDFASERDTTVVHNIKTGDYFCYPTGPKVYYSSSWTGRISKEEQAEIILKKLISDRVQESMEQEIENMIMYGISKPEILK